MAKKGNRAWVWMVAKDKGVSTLRFRTQRNKVNEGQKLELRKFDPAIRQHVLCVETK
jgi:ribosomal protein L33